MYKLNSYNSKSRVLLVLCLCTVMVSGCKEYYYNQYFTYPNTASPHENKWEYIGLFTVYPNSSNNVFIKSDKKVRIEISDKYKSMLIDTYEFSSVSKIEADIVWDEVRSLSIKIYESFSFNDNSKSLVKNDRIFLKEIIYILNPSNNKFTRFVH